MSINDKKFGDIVLSSRQDAEAVREAMRKLRDRYGFATTSDYLELVGIQPSFTDTQEGWADLSKVEIVPVSDGFVLDLPEPTLIDKDQKSIYKLESQLTYDSEKGEIVEFDGLVRHVHEVRKTLREDVLRQALIVELERLGYTVISPPK